MTTRSEVIVAPPTARDSDTPLAHPRFSGRARQLAHLAWWTIFVVIIVMNLLAISPLFQFWQRECVVSECYDQQLRLFQLRSWLELGLSRELYAALALIANFIPVVVFLAVGLVLFRAKPDDGMVYFTSLTLVLFGGVTYSGILGILARENYLWWFPVLIANFAGSLCIIAFFFMFPNGRFVPRWTRLLLALFVIEEALELLNDRPINLRFIPRLVVDGMFLLTIASIVFAQIYRYRRVSNATERRQTKWVVYGSSIALVGFVSAAFLFLSTPLLYENVLAEVGLTLLFSFLISVIPVSIAIATLRARLWNIDLIINRTLVYGGITAILAGVLAVSADLTKRLFLAMTGESSELAPIVATLIVVALFEPVKSRVQRFVDAHLKYPTRSFGEFGEQVKAFVQMNDAEQLAARFLRQALDTFDAKGGAVYLKHGAEMQQAASLGEWDDRAELVEPLEHADIRVGLVALGARANGDPYDDADRASLRQMCDLVAHAIQLTHHARTNSPKA